MSLNNPGLQIKRDMDFSNLTLQCDPRLIGPSSKKDLAGKIAVEHNICHLDLKSLKVKGVAELCDVRCSGPFNLRASGNVTVATSGEYALDSATVNLGNTDGKIGFLGAAAVARVTLLAAGETTDNIVLALKNLGLVKS